MSVLSQASVLRVVADNPGIISSEVAATLGVNPGNAWTVLERLRLSGRLTRYADMRQEPPKVVIYRYEITKSGAKYLEWKEDQA